MPTDPPPGAYVEEDGRRARTIQRVRTSVAAFFGAAPNAGAALRLPTLLTSDRDFQRTFSAKPAATSVLATAVAGFFANGGTRCYVLNLGQHTAALTPADLQLLDAIDEVSVVAAPGFVDAASHEALLTHCEQRQDRFAILDLPKTIEPLARLTRARNDHDGLRPRSSTYAAAYVPWLVTADAATGATTEQPPSGHVAGIYARTDLERGVWKAPANATLRGVTGLTSMISKSEQDVLNPAGVNCIRSSLQGIRVWGARTLAEGDNEWRYIAVRRLAIKIAASIRRGTQWAVFEPNEMPLWAALKGDTEALLYGLWRDGAFQATTPRDAFFVKCDKTTMTQADIDAGRLITMIGIAPVRAAEFIILSIGQIAGKKPCKP